METKLLPGEHIIMPFQDHPFNADTFMCAKFIELKKRFNVQTAVELGSAVGGTTRWLCDNFEKVLAIEINPEYLKHCLRRVEPFDNVECFLGSTVDLLESVLKKTKGNVIFHIDSHWANNNPLIEELEIIRRSGLKPVLEIHDFKVPGHPELGFDVYGPIVYQWSWIEKSIESIYGHGGYTVEYNSEAVGAKRGAIYILPK